MKHLRFLIVVLAAAGGLAGQDRPADPPLEEFAVEALAHLEREGFIPDTFQLRPMRPFPRRVRPEVLEQMIALYGALGARLGVEASSDVLPPPICRKFERVERGESRQFTICEPDPIPRPVDIRGMIRTDGTAYFSVAIRSVVSVGGVGYFSPGYGYSCFGIVVTRDESGEFEARVVSRAATE